MKKYFLKLCALLLLLALPFAAAFTYIQSLPAQFGASIMGTVRHKVQLLQDTPGPRLILAGGSSSPYATDCAYLADEMGMPCINVGATAYLGIDFYISMLETYMQAGDIIVIAPEHSMMSGSVDYVTVWAAMENDASVWRVTPLRYAPQLVGSFYEYAKSKLDLYRSGRGEGADAYYANFGPLGDATVYRESLLASGYNTDDPIALGPDTLSDDFVRAMNRFYAKAQRAGVQVFYAFAPVDELALTTSAAEQQELDALIRQKLALPVLGALADVILPGAYFYDTNNHLTTAGARLYSEALAQNLQAALA